MSKYILIIHALWFISGENNPHASTVTVTQLSDLSPCILNLNKVPEIITRRRTQLNMLSYMHTVTL